MKDLIMKLSAVSGPSGDEKHVREILSELLQSHVDKIQTDVMGNLIAFKKGTSANGKTVLLEANMDEPGVMAIHIEESGLVRIVPIGSLEAKCLIGERIRFTNRVWGVVGIEEKKAGNDVTFADLFVDIGADTQDQAQKLLPIGSAGIIDKGSLELGESRIVGKSLDNRAGCVVLINVLSHLDSYENDLVIVFAVQKEVGSRGIKAAAFYVEADFSLVIGAVNASDTSHRKGSEVYLGKGPAIKVMDGGVIVPPAIKQLLIDSAEKHQIKYQLEICPERKSDAGQILLTRDGIPSGAVSIPVRYINTPSQMIDMGDVEAASFLVKEVLKQIAD